MLKSIKLRIGKRRDNPLISILKCLQDPSSIGCVKNQIFSMTTITEISKMIKNLMRRFFILLFPNGMKRQDMKSANEDDHKKQLEDFISESNTYSQLSDGVYKMLSRYI